jgi:hypothetical protein
MRRYTVEADCRGWLPGDPCAESVRVVFVRPATTGTGRAASFAELFTAAEAARLTWWLRDHGAETIITQARTLWDFPPDAVPWGLRALDPSVLTWWLDDPRLGNPVLGCAPAALPLPASSGRLPSHIPQPEPGG